MIKLNSILKEAIGPDERETYVKFAKELKNHLKREYKIDVSQRLSKSVRSNPYIGYFGKMPNELRVKIMKGLGYKAGNWDNVSYGNIQPNYITLSYAQWKDLLDRKII